MLDQNIGSMTEFKQIIGRGTRLKTDMGKYFFTIMDFRQATNNFADPDFDGEPVKIYEPEKNETPVPDEDDENIIITGKTQEELDLIHDSEINISDV